MSDIRGVLNVTKEHLFWWCPGCKMAHAVIVGMWSFDGNYEAPTFAPSVLVTGPEWQHLRCHSFVREGRIEYLTDCTHDLAGQTVPMEPFKWGDDDE